MLLLLVMLPGGEIAARQEKEKTARKRQNFTSVEKCCSMDAGVDGICRAERRGLPESIG